MWPILFQFEQIRISSLSLFLVLGYFCGSFVVWRRLTDLGYQEDKIIDGILGFSLVSIIGARLIYVFSNFSYKQLNISLLLNWNQFPGFSIWGILFSTLIIGIWLYRKKGKDFWRIADEISYGILVLLILMQAGIFFDGSMTGRPTNQPWGIFMPGEMLRRQPVAVYYIVGFLLIWVLIRKIEKHWRGWDWYKSKANGFIFLITIAGIFGVNLILAFWKDSRLYFLLTEVVISLIGLLLSLIFWIKRADR